MHSCPFSGGEERNQTAEAGADEGQPVVTTIYEVGQRRPCLTDSDRGRQVGEGTVAVAMPEAIKTERGDASSKQQAGQYLITRTVLVRQKAMAEHCAAIGCLLRGGEDCCDSMAEGILKKKEFLP